METFEVEMKSKELQDFMDQPAHWALNYIYYFFFLFAVFLLIATFFVRHSVQVRGFGDIVSQDEALEISITETNLIRNILSNIDHENRQLFLGEPATNLQMLEGLITNISRHACGSSLIIKVDIKGRSTNKGFIRPFFFTGQCVRIEIPTEHTLIDFFLER